MKQQLLIFIINIFFTNAILACNFGTTHPILWHYNQTDKVFIGEVIKVGNAETMDFAYIEKATNIPTYKVRLVVQKTYKGGLKDTVDIGKIALARINFKLGEKYLIYGDYNKSDGILVTGNILNITDSRMKKHDLLNEIAKNPTQLITEYHPITKKIWATGQLKNGQAKGEWKYFEITGELKEKGCYKKGKRHGKWLAYFVTDVGYFNKMIAIKSNNSRRYKFIKEEVTSTAESIYQLRLFYFDKSKNGESSIDYLYKKPTVQRIIHYKKGQLHGKRVVYNYEQEMLEYKTYKRGLLHGESQVITKSNINETVYKKVFKVNFKHGEIVKERILNYENGKLIKD